MQVNVIDRDVKILDPDMPIVQKIGTMARLCYRVEGDNDDEVNARIIKRCISEGHESVLEHGIISLYVHHECNDDSGKICAKNPVPIRNIYLMSSSDSMLKYTEAFNDPDLYGKYCSRYGIESKGVQIMPAFIANVRAWRQIIRERVFISTGNRNRAEFLVVLKMLQQFYKIKGGDVLFGDLVAKINELITNQDIQEFIFEGVIPADASNLNLDYVCDTFFKDNMSVFAEQASPTASFSVILTTDRATTHQLVRHRKNVGYSQESQRYVNYDKKGYNVIHLTANPAKYPADFFENIEFGRVRSTSNAYKEWFKAMEDAFTHYHNLLHIYDDETGNSDLKLLPETCRGVLPNDCATRIGITWMGNSSFINFMFWRLDGHAQFPIRSTAARMVFNGTRIHHPFFMGVKCDIILSWLEAINNDPYLVQDKEAVGQIINEWKSAKAQLEKFISDLQSQQQK